jgi:hypothetical protein
MRLPTASYNLPSRNASRLVNCWAQAANGKGEIEVVGVPGIATSSALEGAGRGLLVSGGRLYAVAGTTLYDALTGAVMGTIPGNGRLMFAAAVDGFVTDNGYAYTGAVEQITDEDKVPWSAVGFADGYIVAVESNSGRFVCSDLNDSTSYDALNFATAEGAPDNLVTLAVDHRQVVLFGTQSTEIWWNSGASGFPFERLSGGVVEQGCLARLGVVKADNSVFWLADDRTVRRLSGQTPVKVSQVGVEEALSGYGTLTDCEAFSFTWNGNIHVVFRFPTEGATWVFNVTTSEWWESTVPIVAAAHYNGRVYVQHEDGAVGYLTSAAHTWFGANPRYEVTFPNLYSGQARQFISQLDVVLRTGDAPAGVIPKMTCEVSHDGGNTWHTLPVREIGRIGEYAKVLRWNRLGSGRDTVIRLSCADPVPFHLVDAQVEVTGGSK